MKRLLSSLLLASWSAACTVAPQTPGDPAPAFSQDLRVGAELQLYPAGLIAGVHVERAASARDLVTGRLAYNATDRQDFGEHDDETGGGPGLGVGWRRFHEPGFAGWFYGGRLDLWLLSIDWEDERSGLNVEGETDIVVLQPSAEAGYGWQQVGGGRLDLSLSLGAEINVDTDGEDVGEGAILLLGLTWTR